jgi:hypothetical protein
VAEFGGGLSEGSELAGVLLAVVPDPETTLPDLVLLELSESEFEPFEDPDPGLMPTEESSSDRSGSFCALTGADCACVCAREGLRDDVDPVKGWVWVRSSPEDSGTDAPGRAKLGG